MLAAALYLAGILAFGLPQAFAQDVMGTVRDAGGAPISGAHVVFGQSGATQQQETMTDEAGKFSLTSQNAGTYLVRVYKDGYRDSEQSLTIPRASEVPLTVLLLKTSDSAEGSAQSQDGTQFSDKPDFTVAGITDWTAAGGHGTDVNLRASEILANDTRALSSKGPLGVSNPESERRLRAAVLKEPASFEAIHALGAFCLRERQFAEAIPSLEKAHQLDGADYQSAYELAEAYEGAGQHGKAQALVQQLLAVKDRAELHRLSGDIEESVNNPLAAEHEYERAAQLDPSEQNYLAWGGELLVHRAVEAAVEVFAKGTRAFPRSERLLAGLGAALYANGAYDAAALRMCDASDIDPSNPQPYLFLGKMEEAAPQALSCAEEELARFAHHQPSNAQANYYYAISLVKSNDAKERAQRAEALLQNAVRFDPHFAQAYLQLGVLQSKRGDWEGARASYEKAAAVDASFPDPHFRLAQIYKRTGDPRKAQAELQSFERLKQSDAAAVEQRRREIRQFVVVLKGSPSSSSK